MDLEAVTNVVLDVEAALDLFDRTADGVHYWERVRFGVHRELRRELGLIGQPHSKTDRSKLATLGSALRSLVLDSPFLAPQSDLLVYGHSRRKRLEDGTWWDVYCDPIVEDLDADSACLERPYEGGHLTPPRTDDLRHLDFVTTAPSIARRLVPERWPLTDEEIESVDEIADRFEAETGVRPSLLDKVRGTLLTRRVRLPLYRRILERVDPELAVVVVGYCRETFVEACHDAGVPVVELQHGVVSPYHMGYAYPGDRTKRAFPDYFLSFGPFWEDAVEFPLPSDRILPVGYPYLEGRLEELDAPSTASTDRIVFVSQGPIGDALSRFAAEFVKRNPGREVVYKLHPGEYSRWRREYPWLERAAEDGDLRVVGDDGPELYDLFADAAAQVGVYSTALYEGLAFDLKTYVVDLQGAAYMDRLVEMGGAALVEDVAGLEAALSESAGRPSVDVGQFFRPDGVANAREAIESIREREAADRRRVVD